MFNKRAESGTAPQLIKHNCLLWIFRSKSCSRTETPEAPRARSITTARARRTAKGADFRRTNAFAINTGTPYRMAALRTDCLFPVVQTQEGSGLSLVPATSAGQSETAPGIEND
jgi:hypothetical protein